jgi:maltose alpha-D-glucosyltransferase / alpha-amylase
MDREKSIHRLPDPEAVAAWQRDPLWFKDALIYEVHVRTFCDSDNDGVGDFAGLTSKLDYIQELGVNTIWLLPFYPSPQRDDGYDIADYHNVHPQYGTRHDFRHFVREAHQRGLKVITELVINHTSDQHAWFQAARRAPPGSSKRDYYVWSDDPVKYAGTRIIFTDTETSNWAWDEVAQAYYWHRFFSHQPDLNFDNPQVLKAVIRTMRFWLDMGVDGLRLDAIPYLVEREGTNNENLPQTHAVVKEIRRVLDEHYGDRVLLAEANQWPEDVRDYFADGDECHMAFHFPLMPRIYMAIAQEDRHPIVEIMQQTPDIPDNCQWGIFLRNHDELTLEMVTSKERDYMYSTYAADPHARINLGIRRRLAPLMENDLDRIKLMNSLLLSMPGSPVLYYGDEIGMGDNIFLGDRNGVRTPMQWSPDRNAGFSRADPQRLYLPPIMDPIYGFEAVNVEAQAREPSSLLNWMRRMLAVRKTSKTFGRGKLTFLKPGNRKILAYLRELDDEIVLCVANLAHSAQPVELDLTRLRGRVPVELMGRTAFPPISELPYLLTLPGFGFYWFRLATDVPTPEWHEPRIAREDLPVLVLFDGWSSFFRDRVVPWRIGMAQKVRAQFEEEVLPRYIETQRWYAAKGDKILRTTLGDCAEWKVGTRNWLFTLVDVETSRTQATYSIPLALAWEDGEEERVRMLAPATLARVRQQAVVGTLADALADEAFCRALVEAIGANRELPSAHGKLQFTRTGVYSELAGDHPELLPVTQSRAQTSNSTVSLGERLFLKAYRQARPGVNPELEMGRYLTEVAGFRNCVPLAGALEYTSAEGTSITLALLQGYVPNQGDGWTYTLAHLEHFLDEHATLATQPVPEDVHGAFLELMAMLGRRTADLHLALAAASGNPRFEPEPVTPTDINAWAARVTEEASRTLDQLAHDRNRLSQPLHDAVDAVLDARQRLLGRIQAAAATHIEGLKIRYHGDYHLGQVLLAKNDFIIIDFEGEPGRPLAQRQQKHCPLRDVAGMLRSFNYARHTALLHATEHHPDSYTALEPLTRRWEAQVRPAFLRAYAERLAGNPLYGSFEAARPLLELFELEKAFYELRYELSHRPDWAIVPLRGIRSYG